ncbi:uncharacterized protein LOC142350281 [Convolutriloba macropyga]|uniref:uncharacterized protein LOC142350281 n=1 Tax=Convolutriloba macropyga TaxID=536237 RepID=UPI003F51E5DC
MAELMLFVSTNFDFVLTVWSILTVVLLWIMTVVCLSNFSFLGIYLLLVAICVTTIEFSKFVQRFICCPEGSIPYKMFHALLWLNLWKRALVYFVAVVILCFLVILNLWAIFIIFAMVVLALLYLYQWYLSRNQPQEGGAAGGEKGFDNAATAGPPPANPAASGYSGY